MGWSGKASLRMGTLELTLNTEKQLDTPRSKNVPEREYCSANILLP